MPALSSQAAALAVFGIAEAVLLAVVFWDLAPRPMLLGWCAALIVGLTPNLLFASWLRQRATLRRMETFRRGAFFASALVMGSLWGWGGYLLYPYGGEIERLLLFTILFGNAIGSGAALTPMPLASVTFSGSVIAPLVLRLLDLGMWQTIALALLLIGFVVALYDTGRRVSVQIRDNVLARRAIARQAEWIEALLKDFTEASSDWLWETDGELKLTYITDGAERVLGSGVPKRLLGKPLTALVGSISLGDGPPSTDGLFQHRPFRNLRLRYTRDDGAVFWLLVSGKPRFAKDGAFLGYRGRTSDISDRVHFEDALKPSEEQLRLVTDSLPGSVTYVDSGLICRFANRTAGRWAGVPASDLAGQPLRRTMTGQSFNQQLPHYQQVLAGEDQYYEGLTSHADGHTRHLETTLVPHRGDDGEVAGFFALALDVTGQREAEERAQHAERMLREALEASDTGYALFDADDRLVFFNGALTRRAGPEAVAVLRPGLSFEELARHTAGQAESEEVDSPAADWLRWRMSIHRTNFAPFELYAARSNRWLRFSEQAMAGGALLISVEDITEIRQQQQQLAQAQKMEAVGQLTGGVAHDFNNMLTSLIGYLDLLRDSRRLEKEDAALVDAALRVGERGASLTRHLLAFSRKQVLAPTPQDVNALIDGMSDLLSRTLGEGVSIETELAEGLWPVLVDDAQLNHALLNLALNARDAMPDGGRLRITTGNVDLTRTLHQGDDELAPGRYVQVTVEDSGTGIDPEILDNVFDPFFTTKDIGEGSGLGLSMVYGFVHQSGGAVRIDSTPGQGTRVVLYLPPLEADDSRPAAVDPAPAQAPVGGGEIILLVEDDAEVRSYVERALASLGYQVIAAIDGAQAMAQLDGAGRIDLLLTDMVLPGDMDGLAVADAYRVRYPEGPLLFMSGYAESEARHRLADAPAGSFLAKPFSLEALGEALQRATGDGSNDRRGAAD